MDEDIKNEILAALKAMHEGAPEVWEHLCGEVVSRGVFITVMGLILLVISTLFARSCIKSYKAGNEDDGATFFVGVIAVVAGVVGVMLATNGGYDAMSPALVLLGR